MIQNSWEVFCWVVVGLLHYTTLSLPNSFRFLQFLLKLSLNLRCSLCTMTLRLLVLSNPTSSRSPISFEFLIRMIWFTISSVKLIVEMISSLIWDSLKVSTWLFMGGCLHDLVLNFILIRDVIFEQPKKVIKYAHGTIVM